jgi:hypothetical protein
MAFAALLMAAGITACSSSAEGDPFHVVSAQGQLHIALETTPQPPAQGTNTVKYTVTDDSGVAQDDLDVAVVPWMPSMGHGSEPNVTQVTPQGNGVYLVTNVVFFMPGYWELRTTFGNKVNDSAAPAFQIQ